MTPSRNVFLTSTGLTLAAIFASAVFFLRDGRDAFMPHAHCYLFNEQLMLLHGGSDLVIGLCYVAISATLIYLVLRARRELPFHWMMVSFATFIVACGGTHLMELWTLEAAQPRYWLSGWVKMVTALASLTTAVVLPPLIPKIRAVLEAARLAGERKRDLEKAYGELDSLYRKVKELDEVKTNFFTNVSHELRTPLSLIFAPIERLLASTPLPGDARADLTMVRRNALMLHKHVNDLLDVSRLEAGRMQMAYTRMDLAAVLRFLTGVFDSMLAERRVNLTLDLPSSLPAEADGDKVQRIALNLVANAFKFSPVEGRIRIALRASGDCAELVVEDNGPGVAPELREAIFERFHRGDEETQRRFGGTGLGLSIVKEFVQAHGGRVHVEGSSLGGARFVVSLPLRAPEGTKVEASSWFSSDPALRTPSANDHQETRWAREQSAQIGDDAEPDTTDKPLVLVAEDNRDMNAFICRVLRSDVRTIAAYDGAEALALSRSRRPDLILTDMMMPGLSGDELVAELRRDPQLAETPIVLLTAKADDDQKLSMLTEGAQDYVVKPFSVDELRARVINHVTAKITRDTLRRELDSQSRDLAQLARELSQRARELEQAKNGAEAANRAKDQFLAVLSHELRTPLTPALAAATNLEQTPEVDPQDLRESVELIRRNIELEARLVDDLLDLTRISKGKLQLQMATVDLHETIQHAAEMCRSEAHNKDCELRLSLEAADRHVLGDGARLAQVVWNLMLNAVKFTPAQGCVGVHTSNPLPGLIRIEVSDTGIGIETAQLARIFEPFHQGEDETARRFGGLGLGLSVARGLVDAHHGTITARSDGRNRGATFTIELPTSATPAPPAIITARPVTVRPGGVNILLVEDHADTRRVLQRLLTRWGHRVVTAGSVEEALAAAAVLRPDLLISDIGLPDGTGNELLEQLRRDGDLIAIAMSGYGMESDLEKTHAAGFREHLVKPVTAERLKQSLERIIAESFHEAR